MNSISAVVITLNEEKNIARCIESLQGIADEVVVVDSGSSDATRSISEAMGGRFFYHGWKGYAEQKNYSETLVSYDWILSIDADEALSETLRHSLSKLKNDGLDEDSVYSVSRLNNFGGVWIHHCGWYPDEKIRLWHRGTCAWEGTVHEGLRFFKTVGRVHLEGDLLHYTSSDTEEFVARQKKYAVLAAEKAFSSGKRSGSLAVLIKPCWTFLSSYILRGGFLDGSAGYSVCRIQAYYTYHKYSRLRGLGRKKIL